MEPDVSLNLAEETAEETDSRERQERDRERETWGDGRGPFGAKGKALVTGVGVAWLSWLFFFVLRHRVCFHFSSSTYRK